MRDPVDEAVTRHYGEGREAFGTMAQGVLYRQGHDGVRRFCIKSGVNIPVK